MNRATVLLATMQLDIGGAETHVVDLACHLTEMGYRVLVASNGGCYVERLTAFGVPHYQVPLHDNKPALLWRSIRAMRRIVRDEQVDLIHAHARIPAFVTAVMGKPEQVRFITTAHYNFKGLWYLSRWGEKTIAVSEDIRDYLIDYFRVPPGAASWSFPTGWTPTCSAPRSRRRWSLVRRTRRPGSPWSAGWTGVCRTWR